MKIDLHKGLNINPEEKRRINGFLLTLFDGIESILKKRRKATYLVHLFEERLSKNEQRVVLRLLNGIIDQISSKDVIGAPITAKIPKEDKIPNELDRLIKSFQTVSSSAKKIRQDSKAEPTVGGENSKVILAGILGVLAKRRNDGK